MTESNDATYLDLFPAWLTSLGEDAAELAPLLRAEGGNPEALAYIAGGLNYVFKSLDLIPDGIDDLGFLDDAFVIRVAAQGAKREGLSAPVLDRLAAEAEHIDLFLKSDFARLVHYVDGLKKGSARGRSVEEILTDAGMREGFLGEVGAWSKSYQKPTFTKDPRTLVKLRAFLSAKLP